MTKEQEEKLNQMQTNAILESDNWFRKLPLREQIYVQELASRVANQFTVMVYDGDRRRGIDKFPEAWETVKNPPLNLGELK